MFDIRFGSGIDELGSLMDASEQCGVIERKGSYYYFESEKLGQVRRLGRGIAAVLWWPADQAQGRHSITLPVLLPAVCLYAGP